MSFPRYPEYKDSGVEWLGEVPAHWGVLQLKRVASLQSGETIRPDQISDEGQFPVYGGNGFRGYTESYTHEGRYALVGRQGALCGNVNYAEGKFWASEHAIVVSPKSALDTYWLGETLRAMDLNQYSTSAAQPGISVEVIERLYVPFPTPEEQSSIASFLASETQRTDALIGEQEKLIALLKEKRQAVISHAVTKGLDPNVPMKDSGIEWLGEVPAHWEVRKIKRLYKFVKRQELADLQVLSVYRDYGVIEKSSRDDNNNKTPEDLSLYQTVRKDDLVINKMKSWQGSLGVSSMDGITSPDYAVYEPIHAENGRFLHHYFRTPLMASVYQTVSNGIRLNQWRLEPEKFEQLEVAVPPYPEQQEIASYIDREIETFQSLTEECGRAMALLLERRACLISAAVTGKIDIRKKSGMEAA